MKKAKFIWRVTSNDGFDDRCNKAFDTINECYNDMRNAALEKMKWNTEYDELLGDDMSVRWDSLFDPENKQIVITCCSCVYTYKIEKITCTYDVIVVKHDWNQFTQYVEHFKDFIFIEDAIKKFYAMEVQYLRRIGEYKDCKRYCADLAPKGAMVKEEYIRFEREDRKEEVYELYIMKNDFSFQ